MMEHRRKRRRPDRLSISAQLVLDDQLVGDIGFLSEDLFTELFPYARDSTLPQHVAVSLWTSRGSVDDVPWSIFPVHPASREKSHGRDISHSTVVYPAKSSGLQILGSDFEAAVNKNTHRGKVTIEVRILDVVPIPLESIYVSINHDTVQALKRSHQNGVNGTHKQSDASINHQLQALVRKALSLRYIIHTSDELHLPLLPHPITHMLPHPTIIKLCEPVSQGLLSPTTRIVLTQETAHQQPHFVQDIALQVPKTDDDASDRFYSADESRSIVLSEVESDDSSQASIEDLSDDSLDEMISLNAPVFGSQTPRGIASPFPGRRTNGINTPGSAISAYSTSGIGTLGKTFKAQGLLHTIPDELLFPRPTSDEDEETRVFVDVSALIRIGCFSGDWVRLEAVSHPRGLALDALSAEPVQWRAVKAYGLPDTYSSGKHLANTRRDENSSFPRSREAPRAYLSPILLANLDSTPYIKLSSMTPPVPALSSPGKQREQITASSVPPAAKEVTLLKISTPLSTDRQYQQVLLARLKRYFEDKRRIVKSGDIVGMSIDENIAKAFYSLSLGEDDSTTDEVLANSVFTEENRSGVAWFRIGGVTAESDDEDEEASWGGIYSIDPSSTRMVQAGSVKGRVPPTASSTWQYYLDVKKLPNTSVGATDVKGQIHPALIPVAPHLSLLRRRLRELISAATNPRAIHLGMAPTSVLLTSTQRGIGKTSVALQAASDIGLHALVIDAFDILTDGGSGGGDVKTEAYLKARSERAFGCGPDNCALIIKHIEALTADRMVNAVKEVFSEARITIATTTDVEKIPDGIRALFTHEIEQTAPDESERRSILRDIVDNKGVKVGTDVELGAVAVKTAALVAGDLVDVVERAIRARDQRIENLVKNSDSGMNQRDIRIAGGEFARCVIKADFDSAVDAARKNFADSIGAPKIPNVSWDDVGGLTNVKDALMETIQLPLERPELFAKGMKKRSGILFYGPPGTGKTLLAKAIATEFSLNFFSVKGPELLNMYIGESEANVRRVFQRARDARPCVVFFDELDSVAPKRGNQGDSGGVMDRIVSQLLAELDGMSDGKEGGGGVFVIGATNRPDLLDAALLRPGRFDKMLYLGVSDTHAKQLTILEALTRKFSLHPDLSLERVAERLPFTYTGADLYALCSDAMLKAITRQASAVDRKIKNLPNGQVSTAYFFDHLATKEDTMVMVTEEDFFTAQEELVASVSATELEHYSRVRETFEEKKESK